jgi:uncharacterized protein (DUF58 family)
MRLTRRGWTVVVVALSGTLMAAWFGARSLNAVVFPCLVALVAAVVQVRRTGTPTVDRTLPPNGFPGETGEVTLRFDVDTPFTATVRDALPPGLAGETGTETTVGRAPVSYEVTYRHRGPHTVGPTSFVAHDVLGLASRRFSARETDDLLVYPRVYDLSNRAKRDLLALHDTAESDDRDEFDRLREYVRGDSLRDVHWKTSAKRGDLVVKEFTAENRSRTVVLSLSAEEGRADEMAEAGATLTLTFLRAGVPVTLVTPAGTLSVAPGDRERALDHLARVGHGTATPEDEPLVAVRATRQGTVVRLGGRELSFDDLVATERAGVNDVTGSGRRRDVRSTDDSDEDRQEVAA